MRHSNETSKEKKARKAKEKTELREERKALARWDRNIKRLRKMGAVVMMAVGLVSVIPMAGNAQQFSLGIGAGASTKGKTVVELTTQYDFGPVLLQAGYMAHVSRSVDAGIYLNIQAGHHFQAEDYFIEPSEDGHS